MLVKATTTEAAPVFAVFEGRCPSKENKILASSPPSA
jgi:hypothetical protein